MWFRRKGITIPKCIVLCLALKFFKGCKAITNADFNTQIRDYSGLENNLNLTDVKTLQKQGLGRYANYVPVQTPVKFKDVPDSVLSGSNHARGLLHQEHTAGYSFDYEDPHFGHGYEYQPHDDHHDPHNYHHYDVHSPGHHHGYGYHHKHYDHALATKTLLWPIAGIALLGAAAALVSNPVLLQLGVVSGKRRRRQVEDIEKFENSIKKWSQLTSDHQEVHDNKVPQKVVRKRMLRKDDFKVVKRVLQSGKSNLNRIDTVVEDPKKYSGEDRRFVPIPLKYRTKK